MHSLKSVVHVTWPSLREPHGRMLGLPFVVAAALPAFLVGWQACLSAATLAILACFIVFVPLTALLLNGGKAMGGDVEMPPLTPRAYAILLLLWTGTAWLFAAALHVG